MRWIFLACFLLFEITAFGIAPVLADRMVNGVVMPDDPANTADIPVRQAARQAREAAFVPQVITRYQLLAALRQMNRNAAFAAYVSGLTSQNQEWWQEKKTFRRTAPEVVALKQAAPAGMALTDAQIDAVWKLAITFDD